MSKPPLHPDHHVQHRFPREVRFCALCGGQMEPRQVLPEKTEHPVCEQCGFVFFPSPKLVAGCLIVKDRRVLLVKRGFPPAIGKWTFPGGFVEFAERAIDAAAREALEEVGLEVTIESLSGVYTDPSNSNAQLVVYLARTDGEPTTSEEAVEVRYFEADEIPWANIAFSSTLEALSDWVKSLASVT